MSPQTNCNCTMVCGLGLCHFQQYFSYIMAVTFEIGSTCPSPVVSPIQYIVVSTVLVGLADRLDGVGASELFFDEMKMISVSYINILSWVL